MCVGAYQSFIKASSGGTGTVNAALNGLSLDGANTVVLGGNPLDRQTLIEGDGFDLLFGTISALNNFSVGYTNDIAFDSTAFGGETNLTISQTEYLEKIANGGLTNILARTNQETLEDIDNGAGIVTHRIQRQDAFFNQAYDGIIHSFNSQRPTSITDLVDDGLNLSSQVSQLKDRFQFAVDDNSTGDDSNKVFWNDQFQEWIENAINRYERFAFANAVYENLESGADYYRTTKTINHLDSDIFDGTYLNRNSRWPFQNDTEITDITGLSSFQIQSIGGWSSQVEDISNNLGQLSNNANRGTWRIADIGIKENISEKTDNREHLTIDVPNGIYESDLQAELDQWDFNFGDTKRGEHWSTTEFLLEFSELTATTLNGSVVDATGSEIRTGDNATSIFNSVKTTFTDVFIESNHNAIKSSLTVTGDAAGYIEALTDSGLGVREAADYSANYTALNLINKTYGDSNVNGMNITNSPAAANDVLVFNGVDLTWQAQSGGGGGAGLKHGASFELASIDQGKASANIIYYIKIIPSADVDITQLGYFITSAGADDITVGVYDLAENLLVQSTVVGPQPAGFIQTSPFPAVSLTGGVEYWAALKGTTGSANFGAKGVFGDDDICQSQFYGAAGLPATMGGTTDSVAAYISGEA